MYLYTGFGLYHSRLTCMYKEQNKVKENIDSTTRQHLISINLDVKIISFNIKIQYIGINT